MQIRCLIFLTGILFLVFIIPESIAAGDDTIYEGTVVDSLTSRPLPFVHILNESTRRGYITDSTGKFRIPWNNGDTLVFISLGYLGKVVIADSLPQMISIVPRSYKIEEVSIESYRTYDQFKRDFLEIKPEKGPQIEGLPKGKPIDVPLLLDTNHISSPAFLVLHPFSFLYYNFSKEEKSKRKVFYLERRQGEQLIVERKFNREIVHRITGLDGDELTNFIGFCNFSHQFLYESTEIEIVKKIYENFEIYSKSE